MTKNKLRIENRVKEVADFIVTSEGTIRKAAKHFGVSKSTIHKDILHRLPEVSYSKYKMVQVVIHNNKNIRHIRGAMASKRKRELERVA